MISATDKQIVKAVENGSYKRILVSKIHGYGRIEKIQKEAQIQKVVIQVTYLGEDNGFLCYGIRKG